MAVSTFNSYHFPGQYHDRETDRYYNWHRHCDPVIGRYMQADPIGIFGGINQYSYVGNMPLVWTDKSGLKRDLNWWDEFGEGRYYGTGYGENAVDWWAGRYETAEHFYSRGYYFFGGFIAAMWTPETWKGTSLALAGAGAAQACGLAAQGPWVGSLQLHPANAIGPHTYPHIQLMLRTGKHLTRHLRFPPEWLMKLFR